ncbi:MAG: methylmalonyl Co-A mutase-associated GTPase MeaB [Deltaproteobacteria bacterium CG11_big_fil_rev_8_21_14_0_20_47_16]|nr:MAG: methylmalonyl Co-A mutase-associated GTPase MeaB [Deltaproteobacteria bacterium CG11_big_fil_rev_8_21_14_0_20_47_16]
MLDLQKTISAFKTGDIRALSRLISLVESRDSESLYLMASLYKEGAKGSCLGITGPPGAGKSTLVDHLIQYRRSQGKTVGVLAIDPSSPFTGGAVLGDRIRMQQHAADAGVYIRSLGSRGAHGGLSVATRDLVRLYQAFGFDEIIVETVGVGQTELDIMQLADTTIVVMVPEAGDTIQTMKAGLTEIADLFIVNKSDRPGATAMVTALQQMIELGEGRVRVQEHDRQHRMIQTSPTGGEEDTIWHIDVLQTIATKNKGIEEVWSKVDAHRAWRVTHPEDVIEVQNRRDAEFAALATEHFGRWLQEQADSTALTHITTQLHAGTLNPYTAVEKLYTHIGLKS